MAERAVCVFVLLLVAAVRLREALVLQVTYPEADENAKTGNFSVVTLTCSDPSGIPENTPVSFERNGDPITAGSNLVTVIDDSQHASITFSFTQSQEGNFRCRASSEMSPASGLAASPPPSSLDHPDDTRYIILPTADSSRSLPLSCPIREGELSERYSIEWYRRLPGQQEVQLSESTYDITVEVTVGPSPSYQCTVNIEHKIGVDVDYSGPQITIESMVLPTIDDLQDVSVNSGETANFTCQFTKGDSNDVTTYWLVADVRYNCDISESDPIRCSTNETTSVLQIDDTTLFNNSEVQCKVQLPAEYINDESFLVEFNEEITRKATLTVLPAPSTVATSTPSPTVSASTPSPTVQGGLRACNNLPQKPGCTEGVVRRLLHIFSILLLVYGTVSSLHPFRVSLSTVTIIAVVTSTPSPTVSASTPSPTVSASTPSPTATNISTVEPGGASPKSVATSTPSPTVLARQCYSCLDCAGAVVEAPGPSASDCCVGTEEGRSYGLPGACTIPQCIVHGFEQPSYTTPESVALQGINFRPNVKGTGQPANIGIIVGTILLEEDTATLSDISNFRPVEVPPETNEQQHLVANSALNIRVIPQSDTISLELDDRINLRFAPDNPAFTPEAYFAGTGEFIRDITSVCIMDDDSLTINFFSTDYELGEEELVVTIEMTIREAQIPFTLTLTPTTADDVLADTRLIATDYLAEASTTLTEAGKATPGLVDGDYNDMVFVKTIPPSTTSRVLSQEIRIKDDDISEIEQHFALVGELGPEVPEEFACFQVTSGEAVCRGRVGATGIRIRDNDPMILGFGERRQTISEAETLSGQGGINREIFITSLRTSEIEYRVGTRSVIEGKPRIEPSDDIQDPLFDGTFGSREVNTINNLVQSEDLNIGSTVSVPLSLFIRDDNLPEEEECFELSIFPVNTPTMTETFQCNIFGDEFLCQQEICIVDDDDAVVGLEMTFYEIPEDVGEVEVCAIVYSPNGNNECPIEFPFEVLLLTTEGSAVPLMDYVPVFAPLIFEECETRRCVDISIEDDMTQETIESFNVTLDRPLDLDSRIHLDPVIGVIRIIDDILARQCYSGLGCTGAVVEAPGPSTSDCCVGTEEGRSYGLPGACTIPQCIVHGFEQPSYTTPESDALQGINFHPNVKGTGQPANIGIIVGTIISEEDTATLSDISNFRPVEVPPETNEQQHLVANSALNIRVIPQSDTISLELDDRINLRFAPDNPAFTPEAYFAGTGEFIRDVTSVRIMDDDSLTINFFSTDYELGEEELVVTIEMTIREAQIPFTLTLTPTTADDVLADTRLIATDYLAEAFTTLTEAGKATPGLVDGDYNDMVFVKTVSPSTTTRVLSQEIRIKDDDISEIEQHFALVGELGPEVPEEFACFQVTFGEAVCRGRVGATGIRIRDNDPMILGFGERRRTISEAEGINREIFITSLRTSEIEYRVGTRSVIEGEPRIEPSDDIQDPLFDGTFGSREVNTINNLVQLEDLNIGSTVSVPLSLFIRDDNLREEEECFELSIFPVNTETMTENFECNMFGDEFLCQHEICIVDDDANCAGTDCSSSSISAGVVAAIVIATLVVVILAGVVIIVGALCIRKKKRTKAHKNDVPMSTFEPPDTKETYADEVSCEVIQSQQQPPAQSRDSLRDEIEDMIVPKHRLQLGEIVGQGESGLVYRGYIDMGEGNQLVAVKTGKHLLTASDKEKLLKEVSIMLSFQHPNVMSLIAVCFDDERPLLIMPFMSFGSLLAHVKQNRERLHCAIETDDTQVKAARKACLDMCYQVSKGMAYLAKRKFVHRDLAARNCMIDCYGVIKVGDFGLTEDMYSTNYYRRDKSTSEEKVPIRWMAPESVEENIYNETTDVWSFGVTCWEVFTCGHVPYAGVPTLTLLKELHSGHRLSRPSNATCSDEIWNLMMSCWSASSQERHRFSSIVNKLSLLLERDTSYLKLSEI